MYGFVKAKRNQVNQVVIAGVTVDMRIKWNAEFQEYQCNVKNANDSHYAIDAEYFTDDWQDAVNSVYIMAHTLILTN